MSKYFKPIKSLTVKEIASMVGAISVEGDDSILINQADTLKNAISGSITFFDKISYLDDLNSTKASACFIKKEYLEKVHCDNVTFIVVEEPYLANATIIANLYPLEQHFAAIHPSAVIASSAKISKTAHISSGVFIGENVEIADNVFIAPNTVIYDGVSIGENTTIYSSVSIKYAEIGSNCIIHDGVRIGQDGFGFVSSKNQGIVKINHIGGVIIGDYVEIGAGTCIDRAVSDFTKIGNHTKLDNLVQIAHNVVVGNYCFLAAMVGIAGSAVIEDFVQIGGHSGIAPHIKVLKGTQIGPHSGVYKTNDTPGEVLIGYPAVPFKSFWRAHVLVKKMLGK